MQQEMQLGSADWKCNEKCIPEMHVGNAVEMQVGNAVETQAENAIGNAVFLG